MIPFCEPSLQRHREARSVPVEESHSSKPGMPARTGAAGRIEQGRREGGKVDVVGMPRWSRRDLARMGAMVAAYAVERMAARIRGDEARETHERTRNG